MASDPVRRIADAVLYEGYILWPYRRSALKNQRRWTFGGVYPRAHSEGREDDPWRVQTQCLLEATDGAEVEVSVRFLHLVERRLEARGPEGPRLVDELTVGGRRHLAWDEATEREIRAPGLGVADLGGAHRVGIDIPAGEEREELREPGGEPAGAVLRRWQALRGSVEVAAEPPAGGTYRLTVRIANETPWPGGPREAALARTFCSAHTVLRCARGRFASLADPPAELREAAAGCRNEGAWPVLVGEPGERTTILSSPIILEDYPRIAPESPGDLFDGGEIDQLLTLNILSLTDEEKAEMRASDPRAREILERTEALSDEELMRLHGAIRDFQVRS
jgi:hypothetical protein